MARRMPEFEMPPAALPPQAPEPDGIEGREPHGIAPPRPEVATEAADVEPSVARRRQPRWQHVAAAALLGLCAGIGVPGAFVAADRAATAGATDALRATALEYVTAIATGDSRRATQMVPIRGLAFVAPPDVLRSATPIAVPEVEVVHIEGDRGTAEVHYRVQGNDVFRTLQAERIDGEWQLRTPLAEVLDTRFDEAASAASIAGVPLGGFLPMMLYPGVYRIDEVAGALVVVGGDVVVVDGDTRTPTTPEVSATVVPAMAERVLALAEATVEACRERPGCLVPAGSRLRFVDRVLVATVHDQEQTVDLIVGFTVFDAPAQDYFQVQVRALLDEDGRPDRWECGQPGAVGGATAPCGP